MDKYSQMVKKYGDGYLLKTRNDKTVYAKYLLGFTWVALISGIVFILLESANEADEMAGIFVGLGIFEIAVGIMCWFLRRECKRTAHAANVELARRGLEQYVEQSYQQTSKGFKKLIITGLALIIGVLVIWSISELSGNSGGGSNDDVVYCRKCGTGYRANHNNGKYIKSNGGYCWKCD